MRALDWSIMETLLKSSSHESHSGRGVSARARLSDRAAIFKAKHTRSNLVWEARNWVYVNDVLGRNWEEEEVIRRYTALDKIRIRALLIGGWF